MRDNDYWLWLCSVPELSRKNMAVLLHYFGSPRAIYHASKEEFAPFIRLHLPWISRLLSFRSEENLHSSSTKLERANARFISCQSPDYPYMLSQIADPPYGLFVRGAMPKQDIYTAAVVGARSCSSYGIHMARDITSALVEEGIQVVSGMALGIDGIAQDEALRRDAPSFAVLGNGVDICYPREHLRLYEALAEGTAEGGILAEYPCGCAPKAWHFPLRNRIISGLSDAVIVVEARKKSGSLITADLALEQGREVYAVPGRSGDVLSGGCNDLIAEGAAGMVVSASDLVEVLVQNAKAKGRKLKGREDETAKHRNTLNKKNHIKCCDLMTNLSAAEKQIYDLLDFTPIDTDRLRVQSGLSAGEFALALIGLETRKLARQAGVNQYVKT